MTTTIWHIIRTTRDLPKVGSTVLITQVHLMAPPDVTIADVVWFDGHKHFVSHPHNPAQVGSSYPYANVVAWAELPKPCKTYPKEKKA